MEEPDNKAPNWAAPKATLRNLGCVPEAKLTAKLDLAKLLAANALAAYRGYASTKNVKTPEKTRSIL